MNKQVRNELVTAILVFILGWMCGMLFVLRMSDPMSIKEKYGNSSSKQIIYDKRSLQ